MDDFFKAPSLTFDARLQQAAQHGERSLDSQFNLAPRFSTQAQDLFTSNPAKPGAEELASLDVTPLSFSNIASTSVKKIDIPIYKDAQSI